jgi:hypothetical protein
MNAMLTIKNAAAVKRIFTESPHFGIYNFVGKKSGK